MGRTQTFDSTQVVRAARDVFWDKGFDAASLPDLEAATGLGRSSLYHAFGSKRGLFDAAVQDYLDTIIRPRLAVLTEAPLSTDAVGEYFGGLIQAIETLHEDSPQRGCLLVNSAIFASHDEALRGVIENYRAELHDAIGQALRSRFTDASSETIVQRTRLLTSLTVSALLIARINRAEAVAVLHSALDLLADWE
ncbi:TetR/AcrR family transcriptional regulator [Glaciibacter psychrotolerans]|uniref:AcrR family transcriptional regulator n=1 Tax=Glaciibacter psychrotolerans TaxID=670054 RepID=A0A7Z0EGQ7_9MICO|nr:TetR/AcrR family transcriptional regulator [Leifsonia psychrotolerans]NYJ21193.1 AcrR family transcriptional regulator [Leifsonia psychrotolerans]